MTSTPVKAVNGSNITLYCSYDGGATYPGGVSINTSTSFKHTISTKTSPVVDTANRTAAAQTLRIVDAIDSSIDGQGTMDIDDYLKWVQWVPTGQPLPCKFTINNQNAVVTANTTSITFSGNYFIESLQLNAQRAQLADVSVTLTQQFTPTIVSNTVG
jgi:hypothetical protein